MLYCAVQLRVGATKARVDQESTPKLDTPAPLVGFAPIEGRSLQFDAIDHESRRYDAEAGVSRILQMVA
jgi:hypothetical protein